MRFVDLLHRWAGGLIGLVLAVIALSGTILLHRSAWVALPHAGDAPARDPLLLARATERMLATSGPAEGIVYASDPFGLHQLRLAHGAGAYADQAGAIVTQWPNNWHRPELWLLDLHHQLLLGKAGEWLTGAAAIVGMVFVVTGTILWWRTRRTFKLRPLPARLSRPAIVMHHRDLGIVLAPLLLFAFLTGAMMTFRPVAAWAVSPFGAPSTFASSFPTPKLHGGPLNPRLDWRTVMAKARQRFPDGDVRTLSLPGKPGAPVAIRVRRAGEWMPNGRSMLWFDAATGELLASRDAMTMPANAQVYNAAYPIHAARTGGLAWRLVMTIAGLGLALLGSLSVWSFWFKRRG